MATTCSDEIAVANRRLKISRLHIQGRKPTDIALELDVSQSAVPRDGVVVFTEIRPGKGGSVYHESAILRKTRVQIIEKSLFLWGSAILSEVPHKNAVW